MYRRKGRLMMLAGITALLLLSGCMEADDGGDGDVGDGPMESPTDGADAEAGTEEDPASGTYTVTMVDNAFQPKEVWVEAGTTIAWANEGQQIHTATAEDGSWDTGDVAAGASADRMFDETGEHAYICEYHAGLGMVGNVHVV